MFGFRIVDRAEVERRDDVDARIEALRYCFAVLFLPAPIAGFQAGSNSDPTRVHIVGLECERAIVTGECLLVAFQPGKGGSEMQPSRRVCRVRLHRFACAGTLLLMLPERATRRANA